MAKCVFCGRNRTLSKEHIYPDWLLKAFPHPDPTARNIRRLSRTDDLDEGFETSTRDEGPVTADPTVRAVCQSGAKGDEGCNNGWMARLEEDSKELLLSLAQGRRRSIGVDEQRLLALWTAKTTVMVEQTNPHRQRAVSPAQRRWLYQHREDREIFAGAYVYLGTLEKPFPTPLGYWHSWTTGRLGSERLFYSTGQQTTFNISRLILSIYSATQPNRVVLDPEPAIANNGLNRYVRLISPQRGPVAYPLRRLNTKPASLDGAPPGSVCALAGSLNATMGRFIDLGTGAVFSKRGWRPE